MGGYAITMLGHFSLLRDGGRVELPATAGRLVAVVALSGDHSRSRLAGVLWPDTTEERARASLRNALWQAGQTAPGLLHANGSVQLATDVQVDVRALREAAHRLMASSTLESTDLALRRYCERELLPDWDDQWLSPERMRIQQLQLHVLESIAGFCLAQGQFGLAIDAALAALRLDPLHEAAHRTIIRTHIEAGNSAAAVRAYRHCVQILEDELGIEPSPETMALAHERVPQSRAPHRWQAVQRLHSVSSWAPLLALVGA